MAGPFGFFNVTKTKYLQIFTSLMRWLAFSAMVTLACLRLANGKIHHPPSFVVDGIPNMFGVCVYSFMCHHSLPSLGKYELYYPNLHNEFIVPLLNFISKLVCLFFSYPNSKKETFIWIGILGLCVHLSVLLFVGFHRYLRF